MPSTKLEPIVVTKRVNIAGIGSDKNGFSQQNFTKQSFSVLLEKWSQETTMHGVKYFSGSNGYLRRLIWLVCVLACLAAVIFQIVDRVQFFDSRPINVNVEINYNKTLQFPAVTICNQNNFRATGAAKQGYYRLIESMFSLNRNTLSKEDLERHHAANISIEGLYTTLAHRKEDFIVNCVWKSSNCSYTDFETVITDHGVCFTFKATSNEMMVSSSGVESGLRLTLNVEQYEYMTGPHDAAGIKILLHDSREMPFVHELGLAVATGTHAFIGVKFMMIDNLPKPYGDCDTKELLHTDYYTTEECNLDCLVKLADKTCGCRDSYMPHKLGNLDCLVKLADETCGCRDSYMPHKLGKPPVCTLEQNIYCLEDVKKNFSMSLRESCGCPIPCHFAMFDPTVSYAAVSNHLVNKLLTSTEAKNLVRKLEAASEVTAKMENDRFTAFVTLASTLYEKYAILKELISTISESLAHIKSSTELIFTEIKDAFITKEMIYRYQDYSIDKNFLRAREAMEERTLSNIVNAYAEFAMVNQRRILRLGADNKTEDSGRSELYQLIYDDLKVRQEIAEMGRANITLLIESFINGTPIFNYQFENISRSHNPYIVPKPLMNYSMHYNQYVQEYVPKLKTDNFDLIYAVLEMFIEQAKTAYENRTVNETELNYVIERFQFACRTYMFSKSVVYTYGFENPSRVITERLKNFINEWESFNEETTHFDEALKSLSDSADRTKDLSVPAMDLIISKMKSFSENGTGSLMTLADIFLSQETNILITTIKDFFQGVQTRGQQIQFALSLMEKPLQNIWTDILTDEDSFEYYNYTNNYAFLRNLSDALQEWADKITGLKEMDIRKHVTNKDEDYLKAHIAVAEYLQQFKDSIVIDGNFIKQNFLQVDIFYRQLSYERINQQKGYDFFALVCDIGGSMGLFIGASMLTIIEIIDLLLIQLPIFKKRKN